MMMDTTSPCPGGEKTSQVAGTSNVLASDRGAGEGSGDSTPRSQVLPLSSVSDVELSVSYLS